MAGGIQEPQEGVWGFLQPAEGRPPAVDAAISVNRGRDDDQSFSPNVHFGQEADVVLLLAPEPIVRAPPGRSDWALVGVQDNVKLSKLLDPLCPVNVNDEATRPRQ